MRYKQGAVIEDRGQRFTCIDVDVRPKRDKSPLLTLVWQTACADCDAPFTFRSGLTPNPARFNRRCAKHKKPRVRAHAKPPDIFS